MIGLVLAAGAGRRLRPHTDTVPKTLVPVDGETTILDIALANLASLDFDTVGVVVGYAAQAIEDRVPSLESRYNVRISLLHNDKAEEWNNAYSLWLARDLLADGALMINGDTVHPPTVEQALLAARTGSGVCLAVDAEKPLADEEMKVAVDDNGLLQRITKKMPPEQAYGEYMGVTLIEPDAAQPLASALQATWERDPDLYYEDGYQEMVDRGERVRTTRIPPGTAWVEVDDTADLERARTIACRY